MVNSALSSKSLIITGIANQKDSYLSTIGLQNSLASSAGYKRAYIHPKNILAIKAHTSVYPLTTNNVLFGRKR